MKVTPTHIEAKIQNAVYKHTIKTCEATERSGHGGNGHHLAQRFCAEVANELQPEIESWCQNLRSSPLTFFRVNHESTQQGLWYDFQGDFTGLIHGPFDFCQNHELAMDFDPEIVGYISVVPSLEQLFDWFSKADIVRLQEHGYFIHEYHAVNIRWYERFQHYVIEQRSSDVIRKIQLDPSTLALIGNDTLSVH